MKNDAKFEEELTRRFKMTWGIWRILLWVLKSLKNLHFNGLLLNKVFNAWAKKLQKSYVSWHWRVMQKLMKNWLAVWKLSWGIWQFLPEHSKVSELGLWCDPFIQSRKWMSLKFTEELCFMAMKMMQNL